VARKAALIAGLNALAVILFKVPALAATHPVSQASPDLTPSGPTGGPPWTFQMTRISIALMVLAAIGIAIAYRHFVMGPQRKLREERRRQRAEQKGTPAAG
jgi:hypothetical protein